MESDGSEHSGGGMSKVAETDDGWDVSSNMTMEVLIFFVRPYDCLFVSSLCLSLDGRNRAIQIENR